MRISAFTGCSIYKLIFVGLISIVICSCEGTNYRLSVSSAVSNLKEIRAAENRVKEQTGNYVELRRLVEDGQISSRLIDQTYLGYIYEVVVSDSEYAVTVVPADEKNIDRLPSFFLDQTGAIRWNLSRRATRKDELIGNQ